MHLADHARENAAKQAGNWQRFESFGWHDRPEDAEAWAIVYLGKTRDSGCLEESNHRVALRMLREADSEGEDWREEHQGHWACGWVEGFAIRCLGPDGEPTKAWLAWTEITNALSDYPILDESDYSEAQVAAESEEWESYGRREFVRALEKHFSASPGITLYPEAALDLLRLTLANRSSREPWTEENGFPVNEWLRQYETGDLRRALAESRKK